MILPCQHPACRALAYSGAERRRSGWVRRSDGWRCKAHASDPVEPEPPAHPLVRAIGAAFVRRMMEGE